MEDPYNFTTDPYQRFNGTFGIKKSRFELDHCPSIFTNPDAFSVQVVDLEKSWKQDSVKHDNLAEFDFRGYLNEVGPCCLEAPQFGHPDIKQFDIRTMTPNGRKASEFQLCHSRPNMRIREMDDATSSGGRGRRSAWFRSSPSQSHVDSCTEIHIDLMQTRLVTHIGTVGSMPFIDPTPRTGESGRLVWSVKKSPTWITSYELYCRNTRTAP